MRVGDIARREVVAIAPEATLRECAQLMRAQHVGTVVLVDPASSRPVGVVTDRDIIVEAVATGLDVTAMTAGDIAASPVACVGEELDLLAALARMREGGVRRLPVTGADGRLVGMLALDDVIAMLGEQADEIARVIAAEAVKERATRA
jgi:CBS domain-containing protein